MNQHPVVLVTGGSSGIGLATGSEFAHRGGHVWLLARDLARLRTALRQVKDACPSADQYCGVVAADVADQVQLEQALREVTERAGVPDIVINSAGTVQPGYFEELDLSLFRDMMEVNYFGALHVCKLVVPAMIERGSGHIVNVCSAAALLPVFGYTAYGASKHALRGLTEVLRLELKPHGVHVSIVYPPDTDTPQLAHENRYKPRETQAFSGGVVLSPSAVAQAIVDGIERDHFVITPGFETTALRRITGLLGDMQYPILDMVVSRARRSTRR